MGPMLEIVYKNGIGKRIYNYIVGPLTRTLRMSTYPNVKHSQRRIVEILLYSAVENQFIESSVSQISTCRTNVPSGDTVFRRFTKLSWEDVLLRMKELNERLFNSWASRNKIVDSAYVAVDFHDIPRYIRKVRKWRDRIKKCDDVHRIVGTQAKHGTHYCHKIASIDIVEEQKFTLGFEPVFCDTDLDELILKLIASAQSKVSVNAVLMDRGFFRGSLIDKLNTYKIPYIIRVIKTPTTTKAIKCMKQDNLPYYISKYVLNKNTHKKGRKIVSTTLLVVDNAVLERNNPELYEDDERYFAFVTNLKVKTVDEAFALARDFRKRWRIETGYRVKETFLAKTCSLSYAMRLFFILLSFVLSNVWVLINCVFRDRPEFVKIFNNYISTHMMKFTFLIVLITLWQADKG